MISIEILVKKIEEEKSLIDSINEQIEENNYNEDMKVSFGEFKTDSYMWIHSGVQEKHLGRLEAFKELLDEQRGKLNGRVRN